jgi:anti-repressor protein
MNAIVPFEFDARPVRIENRNGAPWFSLNDVCAVLEISNPRDAASRLDEDEKGVGITDTLGGEQAAIVINESGLYKLVLRSRKPSAKKFTKWLTAEVLPSIRRTGSYGAVAPALNLMDPATLHRLLLDHTGHAMALEERIGTLTPKAAALDRLADATGALCVTDAAKAIGIGPKKLFGWLLGNEWIFRRSRTETYAAYQRRLDAGWLRHKITRLPRTDGSVKIVEQVLVTARGLVQLAKEVPGAHSPVEGL